MTLTRDRNSMNAKPKDIEICKMQHDDFSFLVKMINNLKEDKSKQMNLIRPQRGTSANKKKKSAE